MKKLILLTIASILLGIFCSAAPVITALLKIPATVWELNANWNLLRQPQAGDTVIIPAGTTVIVTTNDDFGNGNLFIKIYGTLKFIGGKLSMGSGSTIIVYSGGLITGTDINSDQIRIGSSKVYKGAPDVTGPQFANVTTGAGFNLFSSSLPVQFLGFSLSHQSTAVLVQWSTTAEVNAAGYEVERSNNGSSWSSIGSITATGSSNNSTNQYSYTDRSASGTVLYYRIRQIDLDGHFSYTPIKTISQDAGKTDVKIYATTGRVMLQFPRQVKGTVSVRIIASNGLVMNQQVLNNALGQVIVNTNLKGAYVVSVSNNQDIQTATQIIL